jgi:protein-S-isoprenylcysteine O-methyltransferase Ste14
MNDLQVALVGVWGVILAYTQIRSLRSLRRRSPRPRFRTTAEAVLSTILGLFFAGTSVAHFTGIHRQKDVNVFESLVVFLFILAIVGIWQRRADLRRRAVPHEGVPHEGREQR